MTENSQEKFDQISDNGELESPGRREFLIKTPATVAALMMALSQAVSSCAETAPHLWKMKWGPDATKIDRPGHTRWEEIGPEYLRYLLKRVAGGEKIALMLGSWSCDNCEVARKWWEDKNIGLFDPLVFSQPMTKPGDTGEQNLPIAIDSLIGPRDRELKYPLLLFIHREDKRRQKSYPQCVLKMFSGLKESTEEAAKWLEEKGY